MYIIWIVDNDGDNEEKKLTKFGVKHNEEAQVTNGHTCIFVLYCVFLHCIVNALAIYIFLQLWFLILWFFSKQTRLATWSVICVKSNFDFSIFRFFWWADNPLKETDVTSLYPWKMGTWRTFPQLLWGIGFCSASAKESHRCRCRTKSTQDHFLEFF